MKIQFKVIALKNKHVDTISKYGNNGSRIASYITNHMNDLENISKVINQLPRPLLVEVINYMRTSDLIFLCDFIKDVEGLKNEKINSSRMKVIDKYLKTIDETKYTYKSCFKFESEGTDKFDNDIKQALLKNSKHEAFVFARKKFNERFEIKIKSSNAKSSFHCSIKGKYSKKKYFGDIELIVSPNSIHVATFYPNFQEIENKKYLSAYILGRVLIDLYINNMTRFYKYPEINLNCKQDVYDNFYSKLSFLDFHITRNEGSEYLWIKSAFPTVYLF